MEYVLKNKTYLTAEIWEPDGHRVGYLIRGATDGWHIFNYFHQHTSCRPSKNLNIVLKRFTAYLKKNSPL